MQAARVVVMNRLRVEQEPDTTSGSTNVENPMPEPKQPSSEQTRPEYHPRYLPLWKNTFTVIGLYLSIFAVLLLLTFGLFSLVTPTANPYVDIVGFLILPTLLVAGLALMPFGILFKSYRVRRKDPTQRLAFRFPRIDLNDASQRRVAKLVIGSTFVMLPVIGVSGYHGYHFTDSTEFCAKACHTVMEPEGTTYELGAHARVACAECHIGSGASWFVKAKLSGTRQVLAVLTDSFSRPVPPAIKHLRPARETCEHCHWPKKFFGAQLHELVRFAADEQNTRREISMLLKIGGGDDATGRAEGIHLHMALKGSVEYVATDDKLQVIPWVRFTDEAGTELIYRSDGKPSSDPIPGGAVRTLDCMDCHNRPAHKFRAPAEAVDMYLAAGRIDTTLPFIKRKAVEALVQPFPDTKKAEQQVGITLTDFYREQHPDVWKTRRASVNQAIDAVRTIYRTSFFPAMKVDWRTYPDNIGHKISTGCFRCHDGKHVNQRGKAISHACNVCHTFLNPVDPNDDAAVIQEGEFIHPMELVGPHKTLRCNQCHTGGTALDPSCKGCHGDVDAFRHGKLVGFPSYDQEADAMADVVDCEGCHDLEEPTTIAAIDSMCMDCHDDEEYEGMLAGWEKEMTEAMQRSRRSVGEPERRVLDQLRKAGVYHNIEASRAILRKLNGSGEPIADASATAVQTATP